MWQSWHGSNEQGGVQGCTVVPAELVKPPVPRVAWISPLTWVWKATEWQIYVAPQGLVGRCVLGKSLDMSKQWAAECSHPFITFIVSTLCDLLTWTSWATFRSTLIFRLEPDRYRSQWTTLWSEVTVYIGRRYDKSDNNCRNIIIIIIIIIITQT